MSTSGEQKAYTVRSTATLGRALRAAREVEGLTQTELATRSRTNRFSVAQLENGATTKAMEKLFSVLAALELELVVRPRRRTPDA